MKKIIPVLYFLVGLAFICQSAGLIPFASHLSKWFPLAIGWCFIILGVVWYVKGEKAKKNASKEETPENEVLLQDEAPAAEDTQ